jgi:hypothetical protein
MSSRNGTAHGGSIFLQWLGSVRRLGYDYRMKRWLALALLGLAVIWGPYVYSELASEPVPASGKERNMLRMFGGDDEEDVVAEDPSEPPAAEPKEEVAEPEKAPEKPVEAKPAEGEPAEPEEGEADKAAEGPAEDTAPSTLPSDLLPSFRKVFDAEPRDAFWANDEEGKVRAVFVGAGAAAEAITEVACRKTVCRVTFVPDEVEPDALAKLYDTLRTRHPDGLALDHKPEPVGQPGVLFVLRPGYQLEH